MLEHPDIIFTRALDHHRKTVTGQRPSTDSEPRAGIGSAPARRFFGRLLVRQH